MKRTPIFIILFLIVYIIPIQTFSQSQNAPNIVFIFTDDLGYSDLGSYGNPYNETPNIDRLADNGIKFTQAYASSPVCSPSRAGLMTGKYPARLKMTDHTGGGRQSEDSEYVSAEFIRALPTVEETIAEKLKKWNYTSAMIGKWHIGNSGGSSPWDQGFDFVRMIGKNSIDYYNYSIHYNHFEHEFHDDGTYYLTDRLTDYALEFIDSVYNADQPFFLYLSYSAPHVLLVPRGDKLAKYFWKYENFEGKYDANYAAMIESVDDGVGNIYQKLEDLNLTENTIIIFTSDNGGLAIPELGPRPTTLEPLKKWKGHSFEGGIRVPAIFHWKGHWNPGITLDNYFINLDFFPTFLHILDGKTTYWHDGVSLLPLLEGQTMDRGSIYWHYPHFSNQRGRPSGAVRNGDWKLVLHYESGKSELYNLKYDIGERKDLSRKYKSKKKEMRNDLENWLQETDANMPKKRINN